MDRGGRRQLRRILDFLAAAAHILHGTRGLMLGAAALLVLGLVDPILPPDLDRLLFVLPVFAVLVIGAATLAREGVAVQQRARALASTDAGSRRLAQTLVWPALLCILLAPRFFLAAYGIPHISPFTGLLLPAAQQRLTHVFLFVTVLVAALYLRSTKHYARHAVAKRPRELSRDDRSHQERDGLLWMSGITAAVYAWLLYPFWRPFSLLQWPPGLESLDAGSRGVASLTFSLVVPLVLFIVLAGHGALLYDMARRGEIRQRPWLTAWAALHALLGVAAAALHVYDLLWIAQYRAAAPF